MFITTLIHALLVFVNPFLQNDLISGNGNVTVWAHNSIKDNNDNHILELHVYVDGNWKGMLTNSYMEVDDCNVSGGVNFKIKKGKHEILVEGWHRGKQEHNRKQSIEWTGTFEIEEGICTMIKVAKDDNPTLLDSSCNQIGELTIYLTESMKGKVRDTKIYVDGKWVGSLSTYFNKKRICGDSGTITKKLKCGKHKVEIRGIRVGAKASDKNRIYRSFAEFELDGNCITLPIHYQESWQP